MWFLFFANRPRDIVAFLLCCLYTGGFYILTVSFSFYCKVLFFLFQLTRVSVCLLSYTHSVIFFTFSADCNEVVNQNKNKNLNAFVPHFNNNIACLSVRSSVVKCVLVCQCACVCVRTRVCCCWYFVCFSGVWEKHVPLF